MLKKSLLIWLSLSLVSFTFAAEVVSQTWSVAMSWDETAPSITVDSTQWEVSNSVSGTNTWSTETLDSIEVVSPCVWDECNLTWDAQPTGNEMSSTLSTMSVASESMAPAVVNNWTWVAMNTENIGNIKVWPQTTYIALWLLLLLAIGVMFKIRTTKK